MTSIEYYEHNAIEYFTKSVNSSMESIYEEFEKNLLKGAKILDLGCGSGRDSKYFISKGYEVVSIDGSNKMCELAGNYIGKRVLNLQFEDIEFIEEFDAIWACASLLHVNEIDLTEILKKIIKALKRGGVLYASWKYGDEEYYDDGKYYLDMNEKSIDRYIRSLPINIKKIWITQDVMNRQKKWFNLLMIKTE